ncbi:DUF2062 domain-containing protein [Gilvimarinus sp. F26214L]|uniref:DUF2062 domain-containing protein n=1 Tax=Gilvimarinus sp. DZF01 TaxID=3461371 RepID=UPI004045A98B
MARKLIKRWVPDHSSVKRNPALKAFGEVLHDPNLFHLNRHSVSTAVFVGVFVAFLPIVGQMPLAALLSIFLRGNLPLALLLSWISNPFTYAPLFYSTYELGRWILDMPRVSLHPEWSWEWLQTELHRIWKPLLTGSVLSGIVLGGLGYLAMQGFWYWTVMRSWERRRSERASREQPAPGSAQHQQSPEPAPEPNPNPANPDSDLEAERFCRLDAAGPPGGIEGRKKAQKECHAADGQ